MTETIPTAARVSEFTPAALLAADPQPVFWIKTPTPFERDSLASMLVRLGVTQPSTELVRATLIDTLYDLYPEAEADEHANALDTFWQLSAADDQAFSIWYEQEQQRLADIEAGAPDRGPAPKPVTLLTPRQKAKARLLIEDVQQRSDRMLKLVQRRMDYSRQQGFALVRLGLKAIDNMPGFETVKVGADGFATKEYVEALREAMADDAWYQLIERIDQGYNLSGSEVGNSASPPAKPSDPIGSPGPNGASESSDGSSTESSTGPAPTVAFETITA